MQYLVVGGTGQMASGVVAGLAAKGCSVRVLTRSQDKARALGGGASGVVGDLGDPASCRAAFEGVERVFIANALSPSELHEGLAAVRLAQAAGAKRLGYLSVQECDDHCALVPHFAAKYAIERAIRESGIDYTIVRSNNWQQCDLLLKEAILQMGVWPQPIGGKGVSMVDLRDVQEAAVRLLAGEDHVNGICVVAGPQAVTGAQAGEIWSAALGRPVAYGGDDLDAWAQHMASFLPGWLVHALRAMYGRYQARGLIASPADLAQTEAVLGHAPRRYEDFVRETAAAWA